MQNRTMQPRIMRTRAALERPATRYDAGGALSQPISAQGPVGTPQQPLSSLSRFGSGPGATSRMGPPNTSTAPVTGPTPQSPRVTPASNPRQPSQAISATGQPIRSSYDAGTGQTIGRTGSIRIGGRPDNPFAGFRPDVPKSPAGVEGLTQMLDMARFRASQAQTPTPQQYNTTMTVQNTVPNAQPGAYGAGAASAVGGQSSSGGNSPRTGQSSQELIAEESGQSGADDTPDTGGTTPPPSREQLLAAAGYSVDDNGDMWTDDNQGFNGGTNIGNINDPTTWGPEAIKVFGSEGRGDSAVSDSAGGFQEFLEATGAYVVNPKTGRIHDVDANGHVDWESGNTYGSIYDEDFADGRIRALFEEWKKQNQPQEEPQDNFRPWLQEILDSEAPQMDQASLQRMIEASTAREAYEASKAQQAALAQAGRGRMGAGFMAGLSGDIGARQGLQSAENASKMRLQADLQNFQAQLQHYQQQIDALRAGAALSANKDQQEAALAAARQLAVLQGQIQQQLLQKQMEMQNQITTGMVLGGLFNLGGSALGGYLGGLGD